jgi:indole-3-glycerol phosphate synthase
MSAIYEYQIHLNPETVLIAKRQALAARKAKTPIEAIRALASMQKRPHPVLGTVTNGAQTVLIGQVCHQPSSGAYDPVSSALRMLRAGFDALALFTDETVYEGGLNDLTLVSRAVNAPVISQDYVVDEYQVVEARAAGASGLTIYASILDGAAQRLLVSATQRNRMTAIVQVGNEGELTSALAISPQVIALHTGDHLNVDVIKRLREQIPLHIRTFISHPLSTMEEVQAMSNLRADAVLISGALGEQRQVVSTLRQLLQQES